MIAVKFIIIIMACYLIGSIPFGVLVARFRSRVDLRTTGSGKIGTTNVLRTAGKGAAVVVLLLDIGKGTAAALLAGFLVSHMLVPADGGHAGLVPAAKALGAAAALCGHVWPVFLKFKGGRGVATFFGGMAAISWPAAMIGGLVLFAMAGIMRYMSIASITGAVTTLVVQIVITLCWQSSGFAELEYLLFSLLGACFIYIMHRDNIIRLLTGKERRIGQKAELRD